MILYDCAEGINPIKRSWKKTHCPSYFFDVDDGHHRYDIRTV